MEPRERQGLLLGVAVNMLGRASRNLAEHIVEGPREAAECGVAYLCPGQGKTGHLEYPGEH